MSAQQISSDQQRKSVAAITGMPGMCSDDGRALSYYYVVHRNDWNGTGCWADIPGGGCFNTEAEADAFAAKLSLPVVRRAYS